jgi:Undecaprenyl-phosphate galactose phosphotransferase WbaP
LIECAKSFIQMIKKFVSFFLLIFADFIAILLSYLLALILRVEIFPLFFTSFTQHPPNLFNIYLTSEYMFLVWFSVFLYEGLYTKRLAFWEEVKRLTRGTSIASFLVMAAVFLAMRQVYFSRLVIVSAWAISILLLPFFRYIIKILLIRFDLWKKRAIILGSVHSSSALIQSVKENKTLGYEIVGCLSDEPGQIGKLIAGIKVLGHLDDIEEWKMRTGFEDIMVTLPDVPRHKLIPLLKRWENISDSIRYIPRTGDLISTGVEIENIGKTLTLAIRKNLHKPWNVFTKTIVEFVLTLILFVLLLPLFLIIAIAVKIDSPGPIFFVQDRYGKKAKKIRVIKFRSMHTDSDSRLENYLRSDPKARQEWIQYKKLKSCDPRITRMGKFLRKYSLDELPQLLNILKGDMSLVGPRPYIMEELKEVESLKSVILQVKPGITGLWQTSGRSSLPFKERIKIDEYYIRNWSLWLDIIILLKTFRVTTSGSGAF